MKFELELIATSPNLCKIAEKAGATRIELCTGLCEGGTTPSAGLIKASIKSVHIPVFVMIRPRGGDFLYSVEEFKSMQDDISLCKNMGVQGVVTGMITRDGSIDISRNCRLVNLAYPMSVTFHRAFDRTSNPHKSVEDIISCGFERILSSGQKPIAEEGEFLLKDLINQFGNDIIIIPGSGINDQNIEDIAQSTGATEFHLSGKKSKPSDMKFINPKMNEPPVNTTIDINMIELVSKKLKAL